MKINIGDLLITEFNISILVVDILNRNGMIRGVYDHDTEVRHVGYEQSIIDAIKKGEWKHLPVVKRD
jgi:hypothetical protein